MKNMRERYLAATARGVRDVYKKPSTLKLEIEQGILEDMDIEGGRDYRVISSNDSTFTCGYRVGDKIKIITKTKEYYC